MEVADIIITKPKLVDDSTHAKHKNGYRGNYHKDLIKFDKDFLANSIKEKYMNWHKYSHERDEPERIEKFQIPRNFNSVDFDRS